MLKVAVIGTAGRGKDAERLYSVDFLRMCDITNNILKTLTNEPYLVSGGAAWADHIAVNLFNNKVVKYLDLHLPATWDYERYQYGEPTQPGNAGSISNYYHRIFSKRVSIDSLKEIDLALKSCTHTVGNGFFKRNKKVAEAQAVIAFTFGNGSKLKDGGTANTLEAYFSLQNKRKTKDISFHVDLNDWTIHTPASL